MGVLAGVLAGIVVGIMVLAVGTVLYIAMDFVVNALVGLGLSRISAAILVGVVLIGGGIGGFIAATQRHESR